MQKETPHVSLKKLTRGIRNFNLGNIRHSSSRWLGMSPNQTDTQFVQFLSFDYGIRALIILLRNYYVKYNCNTIRKIISRYAPENENSTNKYIDYVSKVVGVSSDSPLDSLDFHTFDKDMQYTTHFYLLVKAICWMESNFELTEKEFRSALLLAL